MAELVDALDSKSSVGNNMSVRVRLPAPGFTYPGLPARQVSPGALYKGAKFHAIFLCFLQNISAKDNSSTYNRMKMMQIIVIKDINPKAPIHYLIIPKKHVADITGFEELKILNLAGQMLLMAKQLLKSLPGSKAFKIVSE